MDARTTPVPKFSLAAAIGDDRIDAYQSSRGPLLWPEGGTGAGAQTKTAAEKEPQARVGVATAARPRVALAHDWLVGMRGGERVLDAIVRLCAERFEISGLFTMFDDGRPLSPAIDGVMKYVSSIGKWPGAAGRGRRWLLPLYPRAVQELRMQLEFEHSRRPIHLLISTSSATIKGLRPPAGVPHLCYCHTPARYLWSQTEQYTKGGLAGRARAIGFGVLGERLRQWDRRTAANVTTFIANSTHTAREIGRVYQREAEVIFPPVRTAQFVPNTVPPTRSGWLYVGALEPYKRADLVVGAAAHTNQTVTIVGTGSELKRLRKRAGANVKFLGRAADNVLSACYRNSAVLLFPQIEDFGIVAVEAQAAGLPVAAFNAGGALDTVIPGKTGVLFDEPTGEGLARAAHDCQALGYVSPACRLNAERFGEERFEREMVEVIERELSRGR